MKNLRTVALAAAATAALLGTAGAPGLPTGRELMEDLREHVSCKDSAMKLLVDFKSPKRTDVAEVLFLTRTDESGVRTLLRFLRPDKVKDTALLAIEKGPGGGQATYVYLPKSKETKKLSAGAAQRKEYKGIDFSFAELLKYQPGDLDHNVLGLTSYTMTKGGKPFEQDRCLLMQSVPRPGTKADFGYLETIFWPDAVRGCKKPYQYYPVSVRFYDQDGNVERTTTVLGLAQRQRRDRPKADLLTPTKISAKHIPKEQSTVIEIAEVVYNVGLPKELFEPKTFGAAKLDDKVFEAPEK
jgi:hypothetical protein